MSKKSAFWFFAPKFAQVFAKKSIYAEFWIFGTKIQIFQYLNFRTFLEHVVCILWAQNMTADVRGSNYKSMNKNFQALFHARQNLKVEDSHRYQMSYWFATHLKNDGSAKMGILAVCPYLWHMLSALLIAFIQRWSGGWYKVLFWNSLHEYTLRVFPLKHF